MDEKEFEQKLVDKIQADNLSPKPRWHFLLKNYVIWVAGLLALLTGALAVSVIIYLLRYNGWEMQEGTHKSLIEFFLLTLPYFWIVFSGIFIFILYYNLKHTKKGYRYPAYLIVLVVILASIILGGAFYSLGIGQKIDNILGERAPFYGQVFNRQITFWFNPDEGRLVGIISSEVEADNFDLVDPSGNVWKILGRRDELNHLPPDFLRLGEPVNIIGSVVAESQFKADVIRLLVPGRGFFSRPNIREGHEKCLRSNCQLLLPPPPPAMMIIK